VGSAELVALFEKAVTRPWAMTDEELWFWDSLEEDEKYDIRCWVRAYQLRCQERQAKRSFRIAPQRARREYGRLSDLAQQALGVERLLRTSDGGRHRRAPGARPVRRPGSRRTGAASASATDPPPAEADDEPPGESELSHSAGGQC
jgi:hypothetical protein